MPDQSPQIDATPTKEFFIHMLTRDVPLSRAIIDLVDNSVDGAARNRNSQTDLNSFWIKIDLSAEKFRISDNCGGIAVKQAKEYAFRFGRAAGAPSTGSSIGQFGVGMKRTIFKLGKEFYIESTTSTSQFTVRQDVDQWKQDEKNWNFQFSSLNEDSIFADDACGTILEITHLHEAVAQQFQLDEFKKQLAREIERAHSINIQRGLGILVNGIPLGPTTLSILKSDILQPVSHTFEHQPDGITPVRVKIVVGVSEERKLDKGGWYVFCNGRLVLGADQTETTGWETKEKDEGNITNIPQYHADFAFFRGFALFDSDNASLLPWTTTKTGVDVDSAVYKAAKLQMMRLMRPVLDFLRRLAEERSAKEKGEQEETPLADALNMAQETSYEAVPTQPIFISPTRSFRREKPTTQRIQYDAKIGDIERAKARLRVNSAKEVGEKTFSYFIQAECDE